MTRRCASCGERFEPARHYHTSCWTCWREDHDPPAREGVRLVPLLDAQTIREAVALTHPDLHPPERQERALRVTQALTSALAETRALEQTA